MQICLWRPGWKLGDVIDFGDKAPGAFQAVIDQARAGQPGRKLEGRRRGTGSAEVVYLSAEPDAGWEILGEQDQRRIPR